MLTTVPLSWIQERMLEVSPDGDPALYVTQVVLPGVGGLDPDLLRAAWQRTGARFAALRTSLAWSPGTPPVQVVGSRPEPLGEHEVSTPLTELGMRPWLDRRARLTGLFSGGKLARLDLVRTRGAAAALVFTFNHVIMDGWSMNIVLDHLVDGLREVTGEPAAGSVDLAGPAVSIPNAEELRFWTRLAGAGTAHPVRGTWRSWADRQVSKSISGALIRVARSAKVTPAALLHVVCVLALVRGADPDLPRLATAISVRGNDLESDDTRGVGCMLAPLPFAIEMRAGTPVRSLLTDTQVLLAELHTRAASYPGFVARVNPPALPTVWLSTGNFPVPTLTSRTEPPYSVERPGAPLSLFAVPGRRFRFQIIRRGEVDSLDEELIADAVADTCALLAENDTRPVADFIGRRVPPSSA